MKQNLFLSAIVILILTIGCQANASFKPLPETTVHEVAIEEASLSISSDTVTVVSDEPQSTIPQNSLATISCTDPTPEMAIDCNDQVRQILAATVRIQLEYWSEGQPVAGQEDGQNEVTGVISHATLVNGRYLITHNHFPVSLHSLQEDQQLRLTLTQLNGEIILRGASLQKFDVVAEWPETLVLDFRESGEVLFKAFGVRSMPVGGLENTQLSPGMEVAQINWDGATTWVQWTHIYSVVDEQGVTQILLDGNVRKGASGGGVFLNGQHIGNNWSSGQVRNVLTGESTAAFSVAAFNVTHELSD